MNDTRLYLRLSVGLALILTAACAGGAAEHAWCRTGSGPQYVLVFWDRSASTQGDRATQEALADILHAVLDDALQCPGDEITGFLVHGRTRGKAHRLPMRHELNLPETRGSRNKVARDSLRYEVELQELREQSWQRLHSLINATVVAPQLTRQTDLLGTIEVVSEELADAPENAVKRVYYFSDMYESMNGPGRRDFDRAAPRDRTEAEAWAQADAKLVLREMNVQPDRFGDVEIRVLLDGHGNRRAADAVKLYWLALLSELGFAPERVHYN